MILPSFPVRRAGVPAKAIRSSPASPSSRHRLLTKMATSPSRPFDPPTTPPHGRLANTLAPLALLAVSAAVYGALLRRRPSSAPSLAYVLLLACQYAAAPVVSRRCIDPRVDRGTLSLVEEVAKAAMGAALFWGGGSDVVRKGFEGWTLKSSLLSAGVPSLLYAVQGVLTYEAMLHLNPVTFNGLSQTKTLATAFCCYVVLNQRQSPVQLLALTMLSAAALLFEGTLSTMLTKARRNGTLATQLAADRRRLMRGILPCLAATFLSGLAGSLSQRGLQIGARPGGRDPFLYTFEISLYSGAVLAADLLRRRRPATGGPLRFWTPATAAPVLLRAGGGVLTALVHKHAGSVAKGFSLVLGLVLSGTVQAILARDGGPTREQVVGTALVLLSSWMHFSLPALL